MKERLKERIAEEWAMLDPVDPLRRLLSDVIDVLAQPAPVQWNPKDHYNDGWRDAMNSIAAQRKPLTDEQRMCSERTADAAYADAYAYAAAAYADAAAAYATADAYADADADAYKEGCKVGRAEAFEQIAEKVKEMPWENDTRDSFLVWLKEQK